MDAQQPQALRIGQRCALQNRHADTRDDEYRQKCQLKTGAEQGVRIDDQNAQRGGSDRVQHVALAIQQAGAQIRGQHQRGPPDRWPDADHESVGERDRDGDDGRQRRVQAELAQGPEDGEGQDAQVHPRDHEHVIRARALELGARGVAQERILAQHHGVHESGLRRRPQLVNFGHNARMNARAPEFDPVAGKAGQPLDAFRPGRAQHADAVVVQVALIVEGAWIAEIARGMQLGADPQARAVGERRQRQVRGPARHRLGIF